MSCERWVFEMRIVRTAWQTRFGSAKQNSDTPLSAKAESRNIPKRRVDATTDTLEIDIGEECEAPTDPNEHGGKYTHIPAF